MDSDSEKKKSNASWDSAGENESNGFKGQGERRLTSLVGQQTMLKQTMGPPFCPLKTVFIVLQNRTNHSRENEQ